MKIVCLNGSPRKKGNSATIAKTFCDSAEKTGAKVRTWYLNKLDYRGCQACYGCKTKSDKCVLKDDLSEVLDAVLDSDILVMATPIYYGEVSAQLKGFIDRTFSYLVPNFENSPNPSRIKPGKKLVMIISQGDPDENAYNDVYPRYSNFFKMMGIETSELIRACGLNAPADVLEHEDILNQAKKLGANFSA